MKHALLILGLALAAAAQQPIDEYNVTWYSPSHDSSGSMPLGNGDIGVNVWADANGEVVFYISKADAWSETVRLLKLGRVRVRLSPNPYVKGERFVQRLNLRGAVLEFRIGKPEDEAALRLWVDANYPIIHVEAETAKPTEMQVIYERWRDQQRVLERDETHSAFGLHNGPDPVISFGDSIVLDSPDTVVWFHRNPKSAWKSIMQLQGLSETAETMQDPLQDRTFGAAIRGAGMARINPTTLRTQTPSQKHRVTIAALTAITPDSETWIRQITQLVARSAAMTIDSSRAGHERWWAEFWNRSYIRIKSGPEAKAVSQAYALQRFINACAGRGAYPIKFNGSIFTTDAKVKDFNFDADYRKWGGPYWFQNTRLIYWPMLASGDFELMQPLFRMYRDALPLAQKRTRLYFDHGGMFFPETMYFWGGYANSDYGWKRDGKPASFVESNYIRNYFSGVLELLVMMLEYNSYSNDRTFERQTIAPFAEGVIDFYDSHYERNADGKIRFAPAQALETWQDVVNPLPEIAGLQYTLTALLTSKVPISRQHNATARRLLLQLPAIPTTEIKGMKVLASAAQILGEIKNRENPELYAIFPYRLYGLEKKDLDLARATFQHRKFQQTGGWQQDAIQAALLGLTSTAQKLVVENFTAATDQRFPAFWGPNFDWTPDQCHGNVAALALQLMLLQTNGDRLLIAPAWPKEWDVQFKLWGSQNTVVEGVITSGNIEKLKVTHDKRTSDIVRSIEAK